MDSNEDYVAEDVVEETITENNAENQPKVSKKAEEPHFLSSLFGGGEEDEMTKRMVRCLI